MSRRYTVWSVQRDGNVVDEYETDWPAAAVLMVDLLHNNNGQRGYRAGITDNNDPELGDVFEGLASEIYPTPAADAPLAEGGR